MFSAPCCTFVVEQNCLISGPRVGWEFIWSPEVQGESCSLELSSLPHSTASFHGNQTNVSFSFANTFQSPLGLKSSFYTLNLPYSNQLPTIFSSFHLHHLWSKKCKIQRQRTPMNFKNFLENGIKNISLLGFEIHSCEVYSESSWKVCIMKTRDFQFLI